MNKLTRHFRVLLSKLGLKKKYGLNGSFIELDYTHSLPDYQKEHPSYDRFLPHLVKYLPDNSVVIDVGANIGDTLVAMVGSNSSLEYISIEADDEFFSDLEKNAELLRATNEKLKITTVKQLVGIDVDDVSLAGSGGTKYAVPGGGQLKSKSLDKTLGELNIDQLSLSLLKTDVDGYDWDIIRSSYNVLKHCPYVFFECEYKNDSQLKEYKDLFDELITRGYTKFAFFDNYGQYICTTSAISHILELLAYVERQNLYNSTRTLYYYDILAHSLEHAQEFDRIIDDYNCRSV
ncbi:MAG: FkbM family methyltransferase [Granulosicoccus sp.]